MKVIVRGITSTAVALLSGQIAAQDKPATASAPRDWASTLRSDAQAFHDRIAADHPGPYNRLDPGFVRHNDQALAVALKRATQVRDFAGYQWAMRGYVASFDDGHVQFSTLQGSPLLTARWPSFLTGLNAAGRQVVMTRAADAPVPLGARLVACDGVAAEPLLAANVGAFSGRWSLSAQRQPRAGRLFLDTGNPFIRRPTRCRFTVAGKPRAVTLHWRPLVDPEWGQRVGETAPATKAVIGARTLTDGTRWFGLPSFDSNPDGAIAKGLRPMIAAMTQDRAGLLAAPRIVFDVRGNGGGSSQWSVDIAKALWGTAAVDAADLGHPFIEWRVSEDNIAQVASYRDEWEKSPDASPDALRWARASLAGLTAARAAGKSLWREPEDSVETKPAGAAGHSRLPVPVYVLTDWSCASACLDAVDLWTALGAIVVGRETSADTTYMEVGDAHLPSGIASVGIPMKVWRGRARGSNVPWVPRYRFAGPMSDTAALERWIAVLPHAAATP
jgi:Peptidase family S41